MFTKGELDGYKAGCWAHQPQVEPGYPELSTVAAAMANPPTPNPDWVIPTPTEEEPT